MINQILALQIDFDFRVFAAPRDPLKHLFKDWVAYYQLKFAIAKVLQPRSILEIGVRFGYSARTFLEAAPNASFVGIDLDSEQFGGCRGAVEWAKKITASFDTEFVIADTQKMSRLPGGIYDLIHVDGQQDGFGTFHDLRRAVAQARWVLMDGYLWTADNLLNATDFVAKYRNVIQCAYVIPGYAGELLLRISDPWLEKNAKVSAGQRTSTDLVQFYDSNYYLTDCGGFEEFRKSSAACVSDHRLLAMLALSRLAPAGRVMDLGCGRGEITYQLARAGGSVTAIDYSSDSIAISRSCFGPEDTAALGRVKFICGDASSIEIPDKFSAIIAGDLIEHLAAHELERVFRRVADHLEATGIFIIHTFPNLWWYEHGYRRRRVEAARLGAFLPAEPRSRYELLMHINEQTPAGLRRQLKSFFRHVCVWVADPDLPGEHLLKPAKLSDWIGERDIYALASHSELDLARAKALLSMQPLPRQCATQTTLNISFCPCEAPVDTPFTVVVSVTNGTDYIFSSFGPNPVHVSYHWFDQSSEKVVVFDGLRTKIPVPIQPGETRELVAAVQSPAAPGLHRLVITFVQEGEFWFDEKSPSSLASALVVVRGDFRSVSSSHDKVIDDGRL